MKRQDFYELRSMEVTSKEIKGDLRVYLRIAFGEGESLK